MMVLQAQPSEAAVHLGDGYQTARPVTISPVVLEQECIAVCICHT